MYRLIDLFSGAGGLTLGFAEAFGDKLAPVWANDNDEACIDTFNLNFGPHGVCGDIESILQTRPFDIPEADIVIGGPPCQGFSLLNKNRIGDSRKELWRPFMKIVKRSNARLFLMENVPQILGSPEHVRIEAHARSMGYKIVSTKLCAADYGVAQVRWRAFILGVKDVDPSMFFPPESTHYNPTPNGNGQLPDSLLKGDKRPWQTVRDAIGDLPEPVGNSIRKVKPPLDLHFGRQPTEKSLLRYRAIPKEGMNRFDLQARAPELTPDCWIRKTKGGTDLFGRLWWNRPAYTIRTEFFKPEKGRYLHPQQHRPITHREAARLQSFPDWFEFSGSKIDIARQIGNAVPPRLAAALAHSILQILEIKHIKSGRYILQEEA